MIFPKLASLILFFGGAAIISVGLVKANLGLVPILDAAMIIGIGICMAWVGYDSLLRGEV